MQIKYQNGRKIPDKFENPIDNILISYCDKMTDFLYKHNITPNSITILRLILISIVIHSLFYKKEIYFPIIGIFIFYFLDCLDGNLARSTNQVTVIGDYLDHFSDMFFYLIFILYMCVNNYNNKFIIIIIFLIFAYMTLVHLGLQQLNYKILNNTDIEVELLDKLNNFHKFNSSDIVWTKYFGSGSLNIVILIITYYIQTNT
jgi:phosphatidylglycerophosphate synthase